MGTGKGREHYIVIGVKAEAVEVVNGAIQYIHPEKITFLSLGEDFDWVVTVHVSGCSFLSASALAQAVAENPALAEKIAYAYLAYLDKDNKCAVPTGEMVARTVLLAILEKVVLGDTAVEAC